MDKLNLFVVMVPLQLVRNNAKRILQQTHFKTLAVIQIIADSMMPILHAQLLLV
jgi:hypothetical protein